MFSHSTLPHIALLHTVPYYTWPHQSSYNKLRRVRHNTIPYYTMQSYHTALPYHISQHTISRHIPYHIKRYHTNHIYRITPYTILYHSIPYQTIQYHTIYHAYITPTILYHIIHTTNHMPYYIIPFNTKSHHNLSHAIPSHTITTQHHAKPYCPIPHQIILPHNKSCHIINTIIIIAILYHHELQALVQN